MVVKLYIFLTDSHVFAQNQIYILRKHAFETIINFSIYDETIPPDQILQKKTWIFIGNGKKALRKRAQFFRIVLAQSGREKMHLLFHTRQTNMCRCVRAGKHHLSILLSALEFDAKWLTQRARSRAGQGHARPFMLPANWNEFENNGAETDFRFDLGYYIFLFFIFVIIM